MEITRKRRTRLYESVVEQIKQLITDGTLALGDQLLPERQLAEKLGVSRSAVREALTALVLQGLIEIAPGSGAFVKEIRIDDLIDPFANVMLRECTDVTDLLEARLVLETGTARLAATRASRADLNSIHEWVRTIDKDVRESRNTDKSDSEFHFCVARAAGNPVLLNLMTILVGMMKENYSPSRQRLVNDPEKRFMWVDNHADIYEAIKNNDPEAAYKAMEKHLQVSIAELKRIQDCEGK